MASPRRRRNRSTRGADAAFGYVIPAFFVIVAAYQQFTQGTIDKYVVGCLLIFGLGALGWRLDVLFETWVRARYGTNAQSPPQEEEK